MWGFLIASLPTEVIMVSLGVTPVASKFNFPTEVVTVSTHCFPLYLVGRCGRGGWLVPQSSGGNNLVLCHDKASGLRGHQISWGISVDFKLLAPLCHPWGVSTDTGRLVSAGKVVGSASGASSLGVHPSDARIVLSILWVVAGWGSKPATSVVVGGTTAPSGGAPVSTSGLRDSIP